MDLAYAVFQAIYGWMDELGNLCGEILPHPF
jgi:hypothetical protein